MKKFVIPTMGLFWTIVGKVIPNLTLGSNLPTFSPISGKISHAFTILGKLGIQSFPCGLLMKTMQE